MDSTPRVDRFGSVATLSVEGCGRRLRLRGRVPRFDICPGDSVYGTGRISFGRSGGRLSTQRTGMRVVHTPVGIRNAAGRLAWRVHRRVRAGLQRSLGERSRWACALVLGDRGLLTRKDRDRIRRLGVSHLFALSGAHLAIVAAMMMLLLRPVRHRATPFLVATITGFVVVAGDILSLRRAWAMAVCAGVARPSGRRSAALDWLGAATGVLLMANPVWARDVGLQLSVGATATILLLAPRLDRAVPSVRIGSPIAACAARIIRGGLLAIALGCGVVFALLPVELGTFGRVSVCGPLATVALTPLVTAVLVCGIGFGIPAAMNWEAGMHAARVPLALAGQALDAALHALASRAPSPIEAASPCPVLFVLGLVMLWKTRSTVLRVGGGLIVVLSFFAPGG